jgi:hypothetical protein
MIDAVLKDIISYFEQVFVIRKPVENNLFYLRPL